MLISNRVDSTLTLSQAVVNAELKADEVGPVVGTIDGRHLEPVEVGSLSHYLEDFIHPRWLFGISSISSRIGTVVCPTEYVSGSSSRALLSTVRGNIPRYVNESFQKVICICFMLMYIFCRPR